LLEFNQLAVNTAAPQYLRVSIAVCNQTGGRTAICLGSCAVNVVEMQTSPDKQNAVSSLPDMPEEHIGFGASKYKRNAVTVIRHALQPLCRLPAVWRIQPNPAEPFPIQTVILNA
jgi:hypothetical protein